MPQHEHYEREKLAAAIDAAQPAAIAGIRASDLSLPEQQILIGLQPVLREFSLTIVDMRNGAFQHDHVLAIVGGLLADIAVRTPENFREADPNLILAAFERNLVSMAAGEMEIPDTRIVVAAETAGRA